MKAASLSQVADEVGGHRHGPAPRLPIPLSAFDRAAGLFRAMGDAERLRLLAILAEGERCVTELAEAVGASLPTVSQRLRVLRSEGLLSRRRAGKHVFYSLADDHVAGLIANALEHTTEQAGPDVGRARARGR